MKEKQLQKMVETGLKEINNKKAGDRFGWKVEWIANRERKMIKSLTATYNTIEKTRTMEIHNNKTIKSVHKNGNKDKTNKFKEDNFL